MAGESIYQSKPWLKSYEKGVPEAIRYEEICMPDILDRTAKQFPEKTALIFQGFTLSFRQLKDMVDRFAACLTTFGVKQGDAVALLLPNVIPCVVAYFAILKIGAISVMNNPLYSDPELDHQFNDSGAKVLVTLDLLGNRMIDLRPKTKIKQIVYTSIGDYLPFPKNLLFPLVAKKKKLAADVKAATDVFKWKDCIAKYAPNPPAVKIGFEDVAMYQYTGGTTGVSKGVMLTHANLSKQVQQLKAWFPAFNNGTEIMLGALLYFHFFGLSVSMNFSIHMGFAQVLVPRPQPEPLLESIRNFRPTFAPLVPTMYIGMLNHPDLKKTDMSCIKGAFSGSAPLPVEVIHDFENNLGKFGFIVNVPTKSTVTGTFSYSVPNKVNLNSLSFNYNFQFFKQPGTDPYAVSLSLNIPNSFSFVSSANFQKNGKTITYDTLAETDFTLPVMLGK